jgi:hypothetical protein
MERWKGESSGPEAGWPDQYTSSRVLQHDPSMPSSSCDIKTTDHASATRYRMPSNLSRVRPALIGLALLSLLPVQAGAAPVSRRPSTSSDRYTSSHWLAGQSKRDRRRSTDRSAVDGTRQVVDSSRRSPSDKELDPRYAEQEHSRPSQRQIPGWSIPTQSNPESSSSTLSPTRSTYLPADITQRRRDGIPPPEPTSTPTPTTEATFRRITVPNTVLPYLLTTDTDGRLGTAGWELYGRLGRDPADLGSDVSTITRTSSLVDPTNPDSAQTTSSLSSISSAVRAVTTQVAAVEDEEVDTTFLITDALPRGWGIRSDRGDLYAVPLITVASVGLAAVIISLIVM